MRPGSFSFLIGHLNRIHDAFYINISVKTSLMRNLKKHVEGIVKTYIIIHKNLCKI